MNRERQVLPSNMSSPKRNSLLTQKNKIISNQGAANARGVSVLMRDNSWIDNSIEQLPIFQTDRHLLISAHHRILKTKLTIAIIYAPNNETERQRFFQALNNEYENTECRPHIILGDFNCTLNTTERIPQHNT
jgi:exonuclease III